MECSCDLENFGAGMVELAMDSFCCLLCDPDTYCLRRHFYHMLENYSPQSGVSLHQSLRLPLATKGDSSSYTQTVICLCVVTAWCRHFVLVLVLVLCPVGCGRSSLDKVLHSPLCQLCGASPGSTFPHPWVVWQLRKLVVFFFKNFPV